MNEADLSHLYSTLKHMSILICYASSISVDAAVFNKPVININYEIKKNNIMLKSPTQHYNSEHYSNALKTEAIDLVNSEKELIESINKYLTNSLIKSAERKKLVNEQCTFTDGQSGTRIANFILNLIK
jgi:CDP-glycerol glycerophosphotransferase (TagB/SpsB family)